MSINKNNTSGAARPALGKGLASLLPAAAAAAPAVAPSAQPTPPALPRVTMGVAVPSMQQEEPLANKERIPGITMADPEAIIANQYQPRRDFDPAALEELAASIRANGIIQPLVVRRGDDGKLHLIAGERRLRASKLAGLRQVPIVIRKSTDKEALELALIENLQREDLNCIDIALSYFQLIEDFQLTQEEVAARVGRDRASVANHLRLLKLPESVIQDLRVGKLSFGHGRALLSLPDPVQREAMRLKIIEKQLSVRDAERLVTEVIAGAPGVVRRKRRAEGEEADQLRALADRVGRALGTRVNIKGGQFRGSFVVEYFSREDLDRLSEKFLS